MANPNLPVQIQRSWRVSRSWQDGYERWDIVTADGLGFVAEAESEEIANWIVHCHNTTPTIWPKESSDVLS